MAAGDSPRPPLVDVNGSSLEHAVAELRATLDGDKELNGREYSDSFLIKYLRAGELDVLRTRDFIRLYFELRGQRAEFFVAPSRCIGIFTDDLIHLAPGRGHKGELVVILNPGQWDTNKFLFENCLSALASFYEYRALVDESFQLNGVIIVLNVLGLSMQHIKNMSLSQQRAAISLFDGALPFIMRRAHIVFTNKIWKVLWNTIKWLLSADTRSRVIVSGSELDELHKDVPRENLPPELDGVSPDSVRFSPDQNELDEMDRLVIEYWDQHRP